MTEGKPRWLNTTTTSDKASAPITVILFCPVDLWSTLQIIMWLLLLAVTLCNASTDLHESVGVLFVNHDQLLQRAIGYDYITIAIKLPDFENVDMLNMETNKVACHTFLIYEQECKDAIKTLNIELNHANHLIQIYNDKMANARILLYNLRFKNLKKRTLLDISGALSALFGTASQSEVTSIQKSLESVIDTVNVHHRNIDGLFDGIKSMTQQANTQTRKINHFIEHTNTKMNKIVDKLNALTDNFTAFYAASLHWEHYFKIIKGMNQIANAKSRAIIQNEMIQTAIHDITNLGISINALVDHKLPTNLITTKDLTIALHDFNKNLKQLYHDRIHINLNGNSHYETAKTYSWFKEDTLLVSIKIPIFDDNPLFDVYQVIKHKVPLHTHEGTNQNISYILQDNTYALAISKDKNKFGLLTESDMQMCEHNKMICDKPTTVYDRSFPHCIHNIFVNRKINDKCTFRKSYTNDIPTATKVAPMRYLLSNVDGQATFHCQSSQPTPVTLTSYAVVTLHCDCVLLTKYFTLSNYEKDCNKFHKETSVKYPINLPQLITINALDIQESPSTQFSANTSPKLDAKEDLQHSDSKEFTLDFMTVNTPQETAPLPMQRFHTDLTDVVGLSILFIWNSILTIIVLLVAFRLRKILLMGLIATPRVEGYVLNPTPSTIPPSPTSTAINQLVIITAIMLVCVTIKYTHIWSLIKSPTSSNESCYLYIKIFTTQHTCLIKLGHLPLDERINIQQTPSISNFQITWKYLIPRLQLEWENPLIGNIKDDVLTINYAKTITTSISNLYNLSQMKSSQDIIFYAMYYMVKRDKILKNLKLDYPHQHEQR